MNTQEKLKIMQAWLDGKTIEWSARSEHDKYWQKSPTPVWDWNLNTYRIKPEPTKKLASEWFKELPEHIQWALPEYENVESDSLEHAVRYLPRWDKLPQGEAFWLRVSNGDYPTKAETALATWADEKVRLSYWSKERCFIPAKVEDGDVVGVNQDGERESWAFLNLADWEVYTEPTKKLASEWFKELPEHIQWALPEYEDVERDSLIDAVHYLPDWGTLPQGTDFWLGVSKADYPSRAETVLATWEGEKVRVKAWKEGYHFIPKTVKNGVVLGVGQDGERDFWPFSGLTDWGLYTEPERKLIDPVRLLGKILWDEKGNALNVITQVRSDSEVKGLEENGYQWSDTVDSERHSMMVEAEGGK